MKGWTFAVFASVVGLAILANSNFVFAARAATVDVENVEFYEGPGPRYKVLERLMKGTKVAASNQAIEGFFKVRNASGAVGFIAADALIFASTSSEDSSSEIPFNGRSDLPKIGPVEPLPPEPVQPAASSSPAFPWDKKVVVQHIRFKILGGYNFFSMGDLNTLFGATSVMQSGYSFGGEFNWLVTHKITLVLRGEKVFKGVLARDTSTTSSYQLDLSSYPVAVGAEFKLTHSPKFSISLAILGGLAFSTDLTSTAVSAVAPNVTDLSATAFSGLAKLEGAFLLTKNLSVFAEVGYRYLRTVQMIPSTSAAVNGSAIFKDPNTQNFVPVSLDLSGPLVSAGLALSF
ncbi:SH3 domain-containing protein [Bdellovibrionota bacterium FG-1]